MYDPLDNTNYEWQEGEKEVCSLGLKFVPMIRKHNIAKKYDDFLKFARKLRLAVFFHRLKSSTATGTRNSQTNISENHTPENQSQDNTNTLDTYSDEFPWTKPSTFEPRIGQNESLELFIQEVESFLFYSGKSKKVKDNLTAQQREALKRLRTWNKDPSCPRMFLVQDKGSRLVVEWKNKYKQRMLNYLEDINVFKEETEDPSQRNMERVQKWAVKWNREEQIGEEEMDWIVSVTSKPGKVYGNIKTHKENWPYRYILSCNGTPIENLAKWIEFHLKPLARIHKAYIKDTGHLLNLLEDLNVSKGPFDAHSTLIVTRDIQNFYPSCDTQRCLKAVEQRLNSRILTSPSTECILEALQITMSSNSAVFDSRFFTQIDGATIGSPDSGSVTDIFGAIYIDDVLEKDCPIPPENYGRFHDDTLDICTNSTKEEQNQVTTWMDQNIYEGKIKFEMKCDDKELEFLDTKITLATGKDESNPDKVYLIPKMYSKSTDTHQYLHPTSCHPAHIAKNLPTSVVHRIRRNCSDNVKNDQLFKDTLVEYKSYLMKSGYEEEHINSKFVRFAARKNRKDLLKPSKNSKSKREMAKYRMVTDFEPTFPNIRAAFHKFQNIFEEDEELKLVFPKGVKHLQLSERRGAKNVKEILAPSSYVFDDHNDNVDEDHNVNNNETNQRDTNENTNGCFPCGKGKCVYCALLSKSQGSTFQSISNKRTFKIRQKINCQSKNVIYLITCKRCNIQGVGHTTNFKKRISNYFSHIKQGHKYCEIATHFIENHKDTWKEDYTNNDDFLIQGIAKLEHPPRSKEQITERLWDFEGYWQMELSTIHPNGLNIKNERREFYYHQKYKKKSR